MRQKRSGIRGALAACAGLAVLLSLPATRLDRALADTVSSDTKDSGSDRPPYAQILGELADLAQQAPGWATVFDYGSSVQGRPLRAIELQDPLVHTGHEPRPTVLITGVTHGNEYLHIEDRLPGWLIANRNRGGVGRFFKAGGTVIVIPIVNPDGYSNNTRENAHGQDLNRDFDLLPTGEAKFKESESRLLARWLDRELTDAHLQLKLTVDYHCCNGSLLNPWSYTEAALPRVDQPAFAVIGQLMQADIDPNYAIGDTAQVLGYVAKGTSKDYYYARYHALAFTFEGRYGVEAQKFRGHTTWWDHVLGGLVAGSRLAAH